MPPRAEASPSQAVVEALGQLTIGFATLELALGGLVWVLIGSGQHVGQIVTAELSFKNLVALFCSLQRSRISDHPVDLKSLGSLRKRLEAAAGRRNTYVHSTWLTSVQDGSLVGMKVTAKAKDGLKFKYDDKAAEGIKALTEDIAALRQELQLLIVKPLK